MSTKTRATVEDLSRVEEKAEIVNGELVRMPATGVGPGYAGDMIFVWLYNYTRLSKRGLAVGDGKGFVVNLPNRLSFSPDAAYYVGAASGMKFFQGTPVFAAEVRSENDHGPQAEREMAAKRRDYFAAGTRVVWDVDLLSDEVVRVYRAGDPNHPTVYRRGEVAEAEPAVPGWRTPVDDLFLEDE